MITAGASYDFGEYHTAAAGFEVIDQGSTETGLVGSLTADYGKYGGTIAVSDPIFDIYGDETVISIEASMRCKGNPPIFNEGISRI